MDIWYLLQYTQCTLYIYGNNCERMYVEPALKCDCEFYLFLKSYDCGHDPR